MLVVHTTIPVDPRQRDRLVEQVEKLVEHSRTEEGTIRYRALEDLTEPNLLRFVEQYENADAAETHTESDVYREFVELLPEVVDGEIETIQYELEDVTVAEFTAEQAVAALD